MSSNRRHSIELDDDDSDDLDTGIQRIRKSGSRKRSAPAPKPRRPPRTERDQSFRCRRCKQFIGAPASGGRHRNHCPNCLHSLHVDLQHPGDRRSDCESLMAPRGLIQRRNGEQLILHECLGCGKTQPTRVAADDNPVLLEELEVIPSDDTTDPDGDLPRT